MLRQQGDILRSVAKRGDANPDDIKAVQQVLPESPLSRLGPHVAVAGRHEAHIHRARGALANAPHLLLLQHAQQLGLSSRRQLSHLVKKQRAPVRLLEKTRTIGHGSRKGSAHVAEQLGVEQVLGYRRAVQVAPASTAPPAQIVNGASHQFLTAAALALNEHAEGRGGRAYDGTADLAHRVAHADERGHQLRGRGGQPRGRVLFVHVRRHQNRRQHEQRFGVRRRASRLRPTRHDGGAWPRVRAHHHANLLSVGLLLRANRHAGLEHATAETGEGTVAHGEDRRHRSGLIRQQVNTAGLQRRGDPLQQRAHRRPVVAGLVRDASQTRGQRERRLCGGWIVDAHRRAMLAGRTRVPCQTPLDGLSKRRRCHRTDAHQPMELAIRLTRTAGPPERIEPDEAGARDTEWRVCEPDQRRDVGEHHRSAGEVPGLRQHAQIGRVRNHPGEQDAGRVGGFDRVFGTLSRVEQMLLPHENLHRHRVDQGPDDRLALTVRQRRHHGRLVKSLLPQPHTREDCMRPGGNRRRPGRGIQHHSTQ